MERSKKEKFLFAGSSIMLFLAAALFFGSIAFWVRAISVQNDIDLGGVYSIIDASSTAITGGLSIGTSTPAASGVILTTNGIRFADNSTQMTAGGTAVNASSISSGIFGSVAGKGNYTFQESTGTSTVLFVDATNGRIGVDTETTILPLTVSGNIVISRAYQGIVFTDPSGGCQRLSVNASGTPVVDSVSCTVGSIVAEAPQNLTATTGVSQVVLNWTAPASSGESPITGYNIYRGLSSTSTLLFTTVEDVLTYTDSGLSNDGTTYYYKVVAVTSIGEGIASNVVSTATFSSASAPTLSLTPATSQMTLDWVAPSSSGGSSITNYKIYRATSTPSNYVLVQTVGNVLTWVNTGLSLGTTYYYYITPVNALGEGTASNVANATVPSVVTPAVTTTSASANSSTSGTGGGNVTSDGGGTITSRGVCYSTSQNPTTPCTSNGTGTGSYSSSISGLSGGTTYYVRAYAANSAGTVYGSQVSFATCQNNGVLVGSFCSGYDYYYTYANGSCGTYNTLQESNSATCGYLPPPTLLSPSNGASGISTSPTFTWSQIGSIVRYNLLVATDQYFTQIAVQIQIQNGMSYTASGLSNNTAYWWKVSGVNSQGNAGTYSNPFAFFVGTPIAYSGSLHSTTDCSSAGGAVVSISGDGSGTQVCQFSGAYCPSGWSQAGGWSTTSGAVGASWSQPALTSISKTCNGYTGTLDAVSAASGVVSSGSHAWSNNSTIESSASCRTLTSNDLYIPASLESYCPMQYGPPTVGNASAMCPQLTGNTYVITFPYQNLYYVRTLALYNGVTATRTQIGCK